jgi:hypothetical protein
MEHELRQNLIRCAEVYSDQRKIGMSTIGRLAAGDWRFFDRLAAAEVTFTIRKYDGVLQWFSDNWPADADWPAGILRPQQSPPTEASRCPAP